MKEKQYTQFSVQPWNSCSNQTITSSNNVLLNTQSKQGIPSINTNLLQTYHTKKLKKQQGKTKNRVSINIQAKNVKNYMKLIDFKQKQMSEDNSQTFNTNKFENQQTCRKQINSTQCRNSVQIADQLYTFQQEPLSLKDRFLKNTISSNQSIYRAEKYSNNASQIFLKNRIIFKSLHNHNNKCLNSMYPVKMSKCRKKARKHSSELAFGNINIQFNSQPKHLNNIFLQDLKYHSSYSRALSGMANQVQIVQKDYRSRKNQKFFSQHKSSAEQKQNKKKEIKFDQNKFAFKKYPKSYKKQILLKTIFTQDQVDMQRLKINGHLSVNELVKFKKTQKYLQIHEKNIINFQKLPFKQIKKNHINIASNTSVLNGLNKSIEQIYYLQKSNKISTQNINSYRKKSGKNVSQNEVVKNFEQNQKYQMIQEKLCQQSLQINKFLQSESNKSTVITTEEEQSITKPKKMQQIFSPNKDFIKSHRSKIQKQNIETSTKRLTKHKQCTLPSAMSIQNKVSVPMNSTIKQMDRKLCTLSPLFLSNHKNQDQKWKKKQYQPYNKKILKNCYYYNCEKIN